MLITRTICVYVVAVFLAAALLAYPLFLTFMALGFDQVPFHKLVTRLLKLFALAGLWPLLAWLGANQRIHWGFGVARKSFVLELLKGFVIGVLILAVLVAGLFGLGVRVLDEPIQLGATTVVVILLKGLVAGLVVGFVEEVWFRGVLFSVLLKFGNLVLAICVTAALYALVHFIRADVTIAQSDVDWNSGFIVLAHCFGRFTSVDIIDSAFALFAAGMLLSLVRWRKGNIAMCIGIHAGWVMVIKTVKSVSHVERASDWNFLIGRYDGVIGILAIAWLALLAIAYYWFEKRR